MMNIVLKTVLLALIFATQKASAKDTQNQNSCRIQVPPENAPLTKTHAANFIVWPAQIDSKYTGCRQTWLADDKPALIAIEVFEKGELVLVNSRPDLDRWKVCAYSATKLVPISDKGCPSSANAFKLLSD